MNANINQEVIRMKITAINPAIISAFADEIIAFYEKNFGFRVIHKGNLISTANPLETVCVLENEAGLRLDVVRLDSAKSAAHGLRINVDDFDAGLALYEAEGFSVMCGPVATETSKRVLLNKRDGAPVLLMQHLKK